WQRGGSQRPFKPHTSGAVQSLLLVQMILMQTPVGLVGSKSVSSGVLQMLLGAQLNENSHDSPSARHASQLGSKTLVSGVFASPAPASIVAESGANAPSGFETSRILSFPQATANNGTNSHDSLRMDLDVPALWRCVTRSPVL